MTSTLKDAQDGDTSDGTPKADEPKPLVLKHIDSGKAKVKTTYRVLKQTESKLYEQVGTVAAANDDSGATAAAEEWGEGEYVLVSVSSWHDHTRMQTTITKWLKG